MDTITCTKNSICEGGRVVGLIRVHESWAGDFLLAFSGRQLLCDKIHVFVFDSAAHFLHVQRSRAVKMILS